MYIISNDKTGTYISAENQDFDNNTLKELKKNDIFYDKEGVFAIRIVGKNKGGNLVQLGTEDDGTIFFEKDRLIFSEVFLSSLKGLIDDYEKRQ